MTQYGREARWSGVAYHSIRLEFGKTGSVENGGQRSPLNAFEAKSDWVGLVD
jgi:hypothetical protein